MTKKFNYILFFLFFLTITNCTIGNKQEFNFLKKRIDNIILDNYCVESQSLVYSKSKDKFNTDKALEYIESISNILIEHQKDSSIAKLDFAERAIPQNWLNNNGSNSCEVIIKGIFTSSNNHEVQFIEVFLPKEQLTQILCIRKIDKEKYETLFLT